MAQIQTKDGATIAYEVLGAGPPLLLLCSLAGPMSLWGRFRERLAEHFTVISLDPRGVGLSSAAPFPFTTSLMASDALDVLSHLGIERASIFGLSLGGMVASQLVLQKPSLVERLVLASTPPSILYLSGRMLLRAPRIALYLRRPAHEALYLLTREIILSKEQDLQQVKEAFYQAPSSRKNLLLQMFAAATHRAQHRLHQIEAKTLILAGADDRLLSVRAPYALQRAISGATVKILEDTGHDLILERPNETAEATHSFLRDGR